MPWKMKYKRYARRVFGKAGKAAPFKSECSLQEWLWDESSRRHIMLNRKININAFGYIISHIIVIVAVVLGFTVAWWVPFAVIPAAALIGILISMGRS